MPKMSENVEKAKEAIKELGPGTSWFALYPVDNFDSALEKLKAASERIGVAVSHTIAGCERRVVLTRMPYPTPRTEPYYEWDGGALRIMIREDAEAQDEGEDSNLDLVVIPANREVIGCVLYDAGRLLKELPDFGIAPEFLTAGVMMFAYMGEADVDGRLHLKDLAIACKNLRIEVP